ncbi:hypothetical protein [Actinophytocola sp.]|uniref:hypothetical protein n=1 Tax=Actinophytocola sp. TaxID=1872138 RepID=UPI003D6A8111
MAEPTWVPHSCTLPTVERPLRVAEFDELLATAVRRVARPEPGRLSLELEPTPEVAATAAGLAARETACCSFFTFALTAAAGRLELAITVGPEHHHVLDGIASSPGRAAGRSPRPPA